MAKHFQILRYLVSGGITALVLFVTLVIFREIFGLWYLLASGLAFCLALVTSFGLQKFWTFRNAGSTNMPKQFLFFIAVSFCNLAINVALMYLAVSVFALQYLVAQFFVTGFIAFFSFFVYRDTIFLYKA